MLNELFQLAIFASKAVIIIVLILLLLIGILAIVSRSRERHGGGGKITLKNLTHHYQETKEDLLREILSEKQFKKFAKDQKKTEKKKPSETVTQKKIFVLDFHGDIKASAVASFREEVTAVLGIATKKDEVVVRLESGGGMVHAYGLAAAQLSRFRQRQIPLTIIIDKIAASGGYMMACVANKIIAAPFAIIGSIGVIVQLPNFHRLLKDKHIDFEQLTAGNHKRTLTLFGENTKEGREKMREEIEDIHELFKAMIHENRPVVDIEKVSTGEHWVASRALELKLVDELKTSDDYLLSLSERSEVFEVSYHIKKSLAEKFSAAAMRFSRSILQTDFYTR